MTLKNNVISSELIRLLPEHSSQWEKLKNKNIFITGGTGLFGRWLSEAIHIGNEIYNLNITATLLTRNIEQSKKRFAFLKDQNKINFIQGDVKNINLMGKSFDYIVHGATTSAEETYHHENATEKFFTLVEGTTNILKNSISIKPQKILFLSSGVVYGPLKNSRNALHESYDSSPLTSSYESGLAQAKRAAEFLFTAYRKEYDLNIIIARCFAFSGPYLPLNLHYALGNFVHQAMNSNEIVINSDGKSLRSYLHLGDMVNWLVNMLTNDTKDLVFNVGSDQEISIKSLAELVRKIVNPTANIVLLNKKNYSVGNSIVNKYVPDISKARKQFNLNPTTSLSHSIECMKKYELQTRDKFM